MLPAKFLHKTGNYNIVINGDAIKVKVVHCAAGIDENINKLRSGSIVGIDYKTIVPVVAYGDQRVLVLSGGKNGDCLVIYWDYMYTNVPKSLKMFLLDCDICFVKARDLNSFMYYRRDDHIPVKCIGAGNLAAQVLHKPDLEGSSFAKISSAVGVPFTDFNDSIDNQFDFKVEQKNARVLTPEQMKRAVVDAYACYKIGMKLLCSP